MFNRLCYDPATDDVRCHFSLEHDHNVHAALRITLLLDFGGGVGARLVDDLDVDLRRRPYSFRPDAQIAAGSPHKRHDRFRPGLAHDSATGERSKSIKTEQRGFADNTVGIRGDARTGQDIPMCARGSPLQRWSQQDY